MKGQNNENKNYSDYSENPNFLVNQKVDKKGKGGFAALFLFWGSIMIWLFDSKNNCPVYPVAGEKVAKELEKASYLEFPNMWEWLGRINKLRQELDMCKR